PLAPPLERTPEQQYGHPASDLSYAFSLHGLSSLGGSCVNVDLHALSPVDALQRATFHLRACTIDLRLRGAVVHLYASLCVCNDDALRRGLENRSLPSLLVFEHANLIRDLRLHGLKRSREDADFVVAIDGESHPIVVRPEAGGSLRDSA